MDAVIQKSAELLEEVVLSRTLNWLRRQEDDVRNACTTFIETIEYVFCLMFKVLQFLVLKDFIEYLYPQLVLVGFLASICRTSKPVH